jgi:hypothetical protein
VSYTISGASRRLSGREMQARPDSAKKIGIHFELEQYFEESGHEPDAEKIPHKIS